MFSLFDDCIIQRKESFINGFNSKRMTNNCAIANWRVIANEYAHDVIHSIFKNLFRCIFANSLFNKKFNQLIVRGVLIVRKGFFDEFNLRIGQVQGCLCVHFSQSHFVDFLGWLYSVIVNETRVLLSLMVF